MGYDNCAILLIDMQPRFMKLLSATKIDSLIRSQRRVLEYCAERDIRLAVLGYQTAGDIHYRLKEKISGVPRRVEVVKMHDDDFEGTCLETQLDEWDPEYLVLMEINASACVFDTAESAAERGFQLATAADLIGNGNSRWGTEWARRWYVENGEYFGKHGELIRWMDSRRGEPDNAVKQRFINNCC